MSYVTHLETVAMEANRLRTASLTGRGIVEAYIALSNALDATHAYLKSEAERVGEPHDGAVRRTDRETSRKAAKSVPGRGHLRRLVWATFAGRDSVNRSEVPGIPVGLTDFELAELFDDFLPGTVSSARVSLKNDYGYIEDAGETRSRPRKDGREVPSTVWRLTEKGRSAWRSLPTTGA